MDIEIRAGLIAVPAELPTYASAGLEHRAAQIARLAASSFEYLASLLDHRPDIQVVVLSEADWPAKGRTPLFGLPNAELGTLVVAGTEAAWWSDVTAMIGEGDRAELASIYAGSDGSVRLGTFFDLVAVHEVAHLFSENTVDFPRLWLGEFFANLCLHTWVERRAPDMLATQVTLPRLGARAEANAFAFQTRQEFEGSYSEIPGPNYAWYQFRLQVAAADLYRTAGEIAARRLFDAFRITSGGSRLPRMSPAPGSATRHWRLGSRRRWTQASEPSRSPSDHPPRHLAGSYTSAMGSERSDPREPFARNEGRSVFGRAAAIYAAARPDYPDRVYDILRDRCHLGPTSRVLEIGAGSGQATKRLLEAGAHVVALEPSEALAAELSARLGTADRLEVVVSTFEDAELAPSSFDLVVAATSFHWLDPEQALPKIAAILRPGGWLALWWNTFGDPDRPDPFHDATEPLLRDLVPSPSAGTGGLPFALDVAARTSELETHGFQDVEHEAERWTLRLDAPQTRRLYETYSNIARLPDPQREMILDEIERIADVEFGGRVERQMVTSVYTGHR